MCDTAGVSRRCSSGSGGVASPLSSIPSDTVRKVYRRICIRNGYPIKEVGHSTTAGSGSIHRAAGHVDEIDLDGRSELRDGRHSHGGRPDHHVEYTNEQFPQLPLAPTRRAIQDRERLLGPARWWVLVAGGRCVQIRRRRRHLPISLESAFEWSEGILIVWVSTGQSGNGLLHDSAEFSIAD
jgi:hypothetical protein